jgi:hypothetical protein
VGDSGTGKARSRPTTQRQELSQMERALMEEKCIPFAAISHATFLSLFILQVAGFCGFMSHSFPYAANSTNKPED